MMSERIPAEVFSLAEFLADEMLERGWTTLDVAVRMGGTVDEMARNQLVVGLILSVQDDKLLLSDENFNDLARAFDVSADYFRNLDAGWRKHPDRRVPFEPSHRLFTAAENRSAFGVVDDA